MSLAADQHLSLERVEHAMKLVAYMMTLDGPVHMPAFEVLEAERERLRRRQDTMSRAMQFLETHTLDGGMKAIR